MASPARPPRAPPSPYTTQPSRGLDPRKAKRILVPATPEYQKIYNEIRQSLERLNLQTHLASQQGLPPPPTAPSTSTIHSPIEDPGTPSTQSITAQDADPPRRQRGRRRGPLDTDTRLKTALKRKLKLTCRRHRAKKITCDCHDFSKLEENYKNSQPLPSSSHTRSHARNDSQLLPPLEQRLNGETFGAGGAAIVSPDLGAPGASDASDALPNELTLGPSTSGREDVVRRSVQEILNGFDSQGVYLSQRMLQVRDPPYLPGNHMGAQPQHGPMESELVEIGSQMHDYPTRWQCEYRGPVDSLSDVSSEACCWTGPIEQLPGHFRDEHHPFQEACPSIRLVCAHCGLQVSNHGDPKSPPSPFPCLRESCPGSTWQRWYYGSMRDESVAGSGITLTLSSESDTGNSWILPPDGSQPWQGAGGSNDGYSRHFSGGNPYEYSYNLHDTKWDTGSDTSSHSSSESSESSTDSSTDSSRYLPDRLHPPADSKYFSKWHPPDPTTTKTTSCDAVEPMCFSHQCPIRLVSRARLRPAYLFAIVLLSLTRVAQESLYTTKPNLPTSHAANPDTTDSFCWLGLPLLLFGFVVTWTIKDRFKSWNIHEPNNPQAINGRPHPRRRLPSIGYDEIKSWRRFGTLMTA